MVENQIDVAETASKMTEVINGSSHFNRGWITQHKPLWTVLPVRKWAQPSIPSPIHLTEDQTEWFANAARFMGCSVCFAIPIQPLIGSSELYTVAMTQEGISEFSRMCGHRNYLLMPEDSSFAVLFSTNGYYIVAGLCDFVRKSVGGYPLVTMRRLFAGYAANPHPSTLQDLKSQLMLTSKRYAFNDVAFYPVDDTNTIRDIKDSAGGMVDDKKNLNPEWLRIHHWTAVPVSKFYHDPDTEWLPSALRSLGHKELFAVNLYDLDTPKCYRVPTTKDGLISFHNQYNMVDFLLFPKDRSCAILSASEYYNVIVGPRDFVVKALGMSIPTARKLFVNRYAVMEDEMGENYMRKIAQRYEEFNGD